MYKVFSNNTLKRVNTLEEAIKEADLVGASIVKEGLMNKSEKQKYLVYMCIREQLKPFGKTYSDVLETPYINGMHWWEAHVTTKEEKEVWLQYCEELHQKLFRSSKKVARQVALEIDLTWGLKQHAET